MKPSDPLSEESLDDRASVTALAPSDDLLDLQAEWLAPARARLLRQAHIARRHRVLDLGTGTGSVLPELVRRAGKGLVIGLDRQLGGLRARAVDGAQKIAADGAHLPLADGSLDLVFSQLTLLWASPLAVVLGEIRRALESGGMLIAIEPDYGGLIEYPPAIATRDLWLASLERAGAEPHIARKLPHALQRLGFDVRVSLFDTLHPASPARFRFLRELPLTRNEAARLDGVEEAAKQLQATLSVAARSEATDPEGEATTVTASATTSASAAWSQIAHLPFFLIRATKT